MILSRPQLLGTDWLSRTGQVNVFAVTQFQCKLTIWLISVMGTLGGGLGDEEPADEVIDWFCGLSLRGGVGGGGDADRLEWLFSVVAVTGCTFTLHSLELRLGDMRDGKLSVFVHWLRLRTILLALGLLSLAIFVVIVVVIQVDGWVAILHFHWSLDRHCFFSPQIYSELFIYFNHQ